jgi:hypothetical protein
MPKLDGFALLPKLRASGSRVPVLERAERVLDAEWRDLALRPSRD